MAPPAPTDTIRVAGLNIWQSGADMVGPPVLACMGLAAIAPALPTSWASLADAASLPGICPAMAARIL